MNNRIHTKIIGHNVGLVLIHYYERQKGEECTISHPPRTWQSNIMELLSLPSPLALTCCGRRK